MQHIPVFKNQDLIKIIVCNHDNIGAYMYIILNSADIAHNVHCNVANLNFYFAQIDFFQIFLLSFTFNKMWSEEI